MKPIPLYTTRFGRIGRATWVRRTLVLAVACTSLGMLAEWIFGDAGAAVLAFVFLWCFSSISGQRLHDRGVSSLNLLWAAVPVVGPVWLLTQMLGAGDDNANFYGDATRPHRDYLQVDITK